jgi:putative ABC transport system permease protein
VISLAAKNIKAGKGRFAFSVGGVAVAVLLLSFILALYRGWSERLTSYLDHTDADLWVVQKGNESFFSPSIMTDTTLDKVSFVPGVTHVSSIVGRTLRLHHGTDAYDAYLMGFDPPVAGSKLGGQGGPVHMVEGSGTPHQGEIVIDDVLRCIAGLDIGDTVTAGDIAVKIVGISSGGNLGVSILCFVSKADGSRLVSNSVSVVNYFLLNVDPGKEADVKASIEKNNADLGVFTRAAFAESSKQVLRRTLLPVLAVVVALIFIVGAVIVGMTMYTTTMEKEREFGVLKALGAKERALLEVVLEQSVVCSLLGFVIGEVAVIGATRLATLLVPQFVTLVRPSDVGIVFGAAMLLSLVAAWLPIRRILSVDPLLVFKA